MPTDPLRQAIIVPEVAAAIDQVAAHVGDYDAWGFSPEQSKFYYSLGYWIYRYFRPVVRGVEHLPMGRALYIANHSGQLPFDGLVISLATLLEAKPPRLLRPMAERWYPTLPYINIAFSRAGVAVGDPINCKNLLEADQPMLVFPEGTRGCGKTWDHAYRLVQFGRGFMRLALQTNAPIIPVAVVGAEESIVSVHNWKSLAKLVGAPYFPIPALLPLLGPLAYMPLPTRFHIHFGEPMYFDGPFDDEDQIIQSKVDQVMQRIQIMIDQGLAQRQSVFG